VKEVEIDRVTSKLKSAQNYNIRARKLQLSLRKDSGKFKIKQKYETDVTKVIQESQNFSLFSRTSREEKPR
jgi:hypothetical protein